MLTKPWARTQIGLRFKNPLIGSAILQTIRIELEVVVYPNSTPIAVYEYSSQPPRPNCPFVPDAQVIKNLSKLRQFYRS